MTAIIPLAFLAGALTVLAPCILPLLPVIVGGSVQGKPGLRRPLVIVTSLGVSVVVCTLLLKASTALLGIPPFIWELLSGLIIVALGASLVWPGVWEPIGAKINRQGGGWLAKSARQRGLLAEIATGAALGPVFSSCSPTYAFIVASILPVSYPVGLLYLAVYVAGLCTVLLLVALLGQQAVATLGWASNPHGTFKTVMGIIFIIVGLLIASGLSKQIEIYLLQNGWYDWQATLEHSLRTPKM